MRNSPKVNIGRNAHGALCHVQLEADFCAEHEWGIKKLRNALGTKYPDGIGVKKNVIVPDNVADYLYFEDGDIRTILVVGDDVRFNRRYGYTITESHAVKELIQMHSYRKDIIRGAWDEGCFVLVAEDDKGRKIIRQLHDKLANGAEIAIWLASIVMKSGLTISIVENLDRAYIKEHEKADLDRRAMLKAAEETGIKDRIDQFNKESRQESDTFGFDRPCGYYALSPRWAFDKEKDKTKYPVMFWLNPMAQDKNNWGWFTVEELELWMAGKGPIPK